jgi:hypothetical protein
MNKYTAVFNFFIDRPLLFISFFFSFIPFWVVYLWYIESNTTVLTAILFFFIIFTAKCIIESEITHRNTFSVMADKLIYYFLWITANLFFLILLIILFILLLVVNDTLFKITILSIIIMSAVSLFLIKYNDYLKNIWSLNKITTYKGSFFINIAIIFSWLIFLFIEPIYMKYISILIIILFEIALFVKKYDSII